MNGLRYLPIWSLLVLVALLAVAEGGGKKVSEEELAQSRVRLNAILSNLKAERQKLAQAENREKGLLDELERLDQELDENRKKSEALNAKAAATSENIEKTRAAIAGRELDLKRQARLIASHVRLLYSLGDQGAVKLALSGESRGQWRQSLHYFGFLIQARNRRFDAFRQLLAELKALVNERETLLAELKELDRELAVEREKTENKKKEREALLARAQDEKASREGKVLELKRAQEDLSGFIAGLEEALAQALLTSESFGRIKDRQGKLTRPVQGRALDKSPGLRFVVQEGKTVMAVFRGHVVYADWFRGYGLLMILDHGDHFYTLYGHNRKLLAGQGEWVEEGEAIAESGDTGSLEGAGLYFEIRHKGQPVSPSRWLSRKSS